MKNYKLTTLEKVVVTISALSAWPICFLFCSYHKDETDERKVAILDYLKSSAKVMMVLEIIGLVFYAVSELIILLGK